MIVYLSKHDPNNSVPLEMCLKYFIKKKYKKIFIFHSSYFFNKKNRNHDINIVFKKLPILFFIIRKLIDYLNKIKLINEHQCFYSKEVNFDFFCMITLFFKYNIKEIHSPFYTPLTYKSLTLTNKKCKRVYHPMNPCDIDIYNWTIENTNILNKKIEDIYENNLRIKGVHSFLKNTDLIISFNNYINQTFINHLKSYSFDLEIDYRIQDYDLNLNLNNHSKKLGFISAAFKIKGLDLIISSEKIKKIGIDVVGNWDNFNISKIKGINFLGVLRSKNRDNWYKKIGIIIVPSYFDGMPRVIIEAISFGCIVLCSDSCGYSFFLEKEQIFKSGRKNDLEKKLLVLMQYSTKKRKSIIMKNYNFIKKYQ